jgi:hypothetical protein
MFRRNLHRGMAAIMFAAALALGSAQPAAAQGFVWREAWDWLSGLLGGVTFLHAATEADGATVQGGSESGTSGPGANGECGPEIDPNGRCQPATGSGSGS